MKILKQGTPPQEAVYRATCRNCKTEIEFKQSEGRLISDYRDGDYVSVLCPVCSSDINCSVRLGSMAIGRKSIDGNVVRTKSQVLAERQTVVGCCNRHADNMGCDCLENAVDG